MNFVTMSFSLDLIVYQELLSSSILGRSPGLWTLILNVLKESMVQSPVDRLAFLVIRKDCMVSREKTKPLSMPTPLEVNPLGSVLPPPPNVSVYVSSHDEGFKILFNQILFRHLN